MPVVHDHEINIGHCLVSQRSEGSVDHTIGSDGDHDSGDAQAPYFQKTLHKSYNRRNGIVILQLNEP